MKIKSIKIQYLTLATIIGLSVALFGMTSALPGFIESFKDYQTTSEYSGVELNIAYTEKDAKFYERVASQLEPLYPEFTFVPEPRSLTFKSLDVMDEQKIPLIVGELKAVEPGIFWSVAEACVGRNCAEKIKFKLVAKKLEIKNEVK